MSSLLLPSAENFITSLLNTQRSRVALTQAPGNCKGRKGCNSVICRVDSLTGRTRQTSAPRDRPHCRTSTRSYFTKGHVGASALGRGRRVMGSGRSHSCKVKFLPGDAWLSTFPESEQQRCGFCLHLSFRKCEPLLCGRIAF